MCLFEESHCSPALLKMSIYFTELVAVIFVLQSTVLNKCTKALATTHVNLTISQQELQLFKYIKFLEVQLYKFALTSVNFGKATFSKELPFRSTYFGVLITTLSGHYSFWEQLL